MAPRPRTNLHDLSAAFEGALVQRDGFSPEAVENFYVFLKEAKFVVDRRIIEPDKFFWLDPLYKVTRTELFGVKDSQGGWLQRPRFETGILYRKASQMGASVWSIVFMLWLCVDRSRPVGVACFWPNEGELQTFVQTRLDPLLASSEKMKAYMEDTKVDSTRAKQIGLSTIYFRHVSGNSSADSIPVDVVICDEVRLWDTPKATVQRLKERYGQSELKLLVLMSTVGSKGDYMEQMWAESVQMKYFSLCPEGDCHTEVGPDPNLPDRLFRGDRLEEADPARPLVRGVVLSDFLPDEIVREGDGLDARYRCPCCGGAVPNPRAGGYVAARPESLGMYAIEFARTLSPSLTPFTLLSEFRKADDMKQFMNGYLGKPWLDPEGRPVRAEHWERALTDEFGWADRGEGGRNHLGIDLRTREMHFVVGEAPDPGRHQGRLLRVGVYQGDDWQDFFRYLMDRFAIDKAVMDYMPFSTETLKLADEYEGRLFLAQYKPGEMIRTPATENGKAKKKVSPDAREKHMVLLDQVKALNWSLGSFAAGQWRVPQGPLHQENYLDRVKQRHPLFDIVGGLEGVGREGFKAHLMGLALITKEADTTNSAGEKVGVSGKQTQVFIDADNFDPHFAHAFNYMVMSTRLDGAGMTLLRSPQGTARTLGPGAGLPVPEAVRRMPKRVCGDCLHRDESTSLCRALGWEVSPGDPECGYRLWRPADRFRSTPDPVLLPVDS